MVLKYGFDGFSSHWWGLGAILYIQGNIGTCRQDGAASMICEVKGYRRTLSVTVSPAGKDLLSVHGELRDPDHEFDLEFMLLIPERRIIGPKVTFHHEPYPVCSAAIARVKDLDGVQIIYGFSSKAALMVGGPKGCTHVLELVMQCARTVSTVLFGTTKGGRTWKDIEERHPSEHKNLEPHLAGTCVGFPRS